MAFSSSALKFTVRRKDRTPRELKRLSNIIYFFFWCDHRREDDPAQVIRNAVAEALVHYYPFAGHLRELKGRKLAVECTGEGVLFIEADADVRLDQFRDALQPPFPAWKSSSSTPRALPGSSALLDTPLLLFQVTRFLCGGFVLGVRMQHTMTDGPGLVQLLGAIAELARGATAPTVLPVWGRELLEARNPPLPPSFAHREYDELTDSTIMSVDDMVHRSFFFGPREVATIRSHLSPDLRESTTTFEVLTGCLWKCRTVALSPPVHEEMRMICIVNLRGKRGAESIPHGYYGNAFVFPTAISTAGDLCTNPVGYAVRLVKKVKREVDMEYIRSVADLMVQRGRTHFSVAHAYLVSDLSKSGLRDIDFGWGKPVYAGPAKGGVGAIPGVASFFIAFQNIKGEDGVVVPVCLPGPAVMYKFEEEINKLLSPSVHVDPEAP